ncbi:MAG: replication-associated recombination protein A [Armatimonadetes bacterium]|nr:replication-associated recombination protein A [Armatimonadota bacterium]
MRRSDDDQPTDLFDHAATKAAESEAPLAARMRPRTLDEFIGQEHIVGPGKLLRRAIETDELRSVIFWGPPGCGKSSLASIIARTTKSHFDNFSAVTSGVADIRKIIEKARERRKFYGHKTILFVDEIHRFNKAQQDAFLPHVEDGTIVLIGATTENPYFEVNSPLISRSRIFRFEQLGDEQMEQIIRQAIEDEERGLGKFRVEVAEEAMRFMVGIANGDARGVLNALELAALTIPPDEEGRRLVTVELAEEAIQQRAISYDKDGDNHYDIISAFIKSMRGSDPDAALYWLARMIYAGEDARFIARRIVIQAAEDVGNADPMALVLATAAAHAVEYVGMPEAQIPLAQAAVYLACAPKSNASYLGISRALKDVAERRTEPVPLHLRDTNYRGARQMGHGRGYKYPHDFPGGYVEQRYVPEGAQSQPYYEPTERGREAKFKARLDRIRGKSEGSDEPEGE